MSRPRPARVSLTLLSLAVLGSLACGAPGEPLPRPASLDQLDPALAAEIETLSSRAAAAPGEPERRLELGMLYEANSLFALAAATYESVLRQHDDDPRVWFRLAISRERLGDLAGAIAALTECVERDPDYAPATARLATWLLDAGEVEAAARHAQRALRRPEVVEEAVFAGVRVHLAQGNTAAAIALAEAGGILAGPNAPFARQLLARAYRAEGRFDDAERIASEPEVARPVFEDPWSRETSRLRVPPRRFAEAGRLIQARDYAAALPLLQELESAGEADQRVYNMLAQCYLETGDPERARTALAAAVELAPNHFGTRFNLAKVLLLSAAGKPADLEAALAEADAAIALQPASGEAHLLRGAVLLSLDRADDAIAAYREGWRLDARDPEPLRRAARRLMNQRRWPAAAALFESLLATDADDAGALLGLARCAMESGRFDRAEALLGRLEDGDGPASELTAARARLAALRAAGGA